jgi:glutathione S-transferase
VSYQHQDANAFAPPDGFREVGPLGRISAFRHNDRAIDDSSVICRYVDRLGRKSPPYPRIRMRARASLARSDAPF